MKETVNQTSKVLRSSRSTNRPSKRIPSGMESIGTSSSGRLAFPMALGTSGRVAWLLVAGCPILFALATWPVAGFVWQDSVRHFSLPIIAVELFVIILAMSDGFEPGRAIAAAPVWVGAALALLTAVALGTALLVAPDRPGAIVRTCSSIIHVLFSFSLVHLLTGTWRPLLPYVWSSIALGTLGYALVLTIYVSSIPNPDAYPWAVFQLAVTHVRQLGFYSAVGACTALGLAFTSESKRAQSGWLACSSMMIAISFWSGTRSSLIAIAAAYLISLLSFPLLRRPKAWGQAIMAAVGGLAISLLHHVPHPMFGPLRIWMASNASDPGSGRLEVWLGTLQACLERPLFGYGESQFRLLVPEVEGALNHPHNVFLQILFQWGLVGATCYFVLAIFLLVRFKNSIQQLGSAALPAYFVTVALLTYSLYEGTLYHPYPIAMLATGIAWALASGNASAKSGNQLAG